MSTLNRQRLRSTVSSSVRHVVTMMNPACTRSPSGPVISVPAACGSSVARPSESTALAANSIVSRSSSVSAWWTRGTSADSDNVRASPVKLMLSGLISIGAPYTRATTDARTIAEPASAGAVNSTGIRPTSRGSARAASASEPETSMLHAFEASPRSACPRQWGPYRPPFVVVIVIDEIASACDAIPFWFSTASSILPSRPIRIGPTSRFSRPSDAEATCSTVPTLIDDEVKYSACPRCQRRCTSLL